MFSNCLTTHLTIVYFMCSYRLEYRCWKSFEFYEYITVHVYIGTIDKCCEIRNNTNIITYWFNEQSSQYYSVNLTLIRIVMVVNHIIEQYNFQ